MIYLILAGILVLVLIIVAKNEQKPNYLFVNYTERLPQKKKQPFFAFRTKSQIEEVVKQRSLRLDLNKGLTYQKNYHQNLYKGLLETQDSRILWAAARTPLSKSKSKPENIRLIFDQTKMRYDYQSLEDLDKELKSQTILFNYVALQESRQPFNEKLSTYLILAIIMLSIIGLNNLYIN